MYSNHNLPPPVLCINCFSGPGGSKVKCIREYMLNRCQESVKLYKKLSKYTGILNVNVLVKQNLRKK